MAIQEQLIQKREVSTKSKSNDIVNRLRKEVESNPVFNAVMHKFALRERARAQVTLHSLTQTMTNEGYKYKREEYVGVLKTLGALGVGRLEFDSKNRLVALKDIKITLQSIGKAAIGGGEQLNNTKFQRRFKNLPQTSAVLPVKRAISPAVKSDTVQAVNIRYAAEVTVKFNKDEITTFKIPGGLSPKELGLLLSMNYFKKEE